MKNKRGVQYGVRQDNDNNLYYSLDLQVFSRLYPAELLYLSKGERLSPARFAVLADSFYWWAWELWDLDRGDLGDIGEERTKIEKFMHPKNFSPYVDWNSEQ